MPHPRVCCTRLEPPRIRHENQTARLCKLARIITNGQPATPVGFEPQHHSKQQRIFSRMETQQQAPTLPLANGTKTQNVMQRFGIITEYDKSSKTFRLASTHILSTITCQRHPCDLKPSTTTSTPESLCTHGPQPPSLIHTIGITTESVKSPKR